MDEEDPVAADLPAAESYAAERGLYRKQKKLD
jgi:hypothetical protein